MPVLVAITSTSSGHGVVGHTEGTRIGLNQLLDEVSGRQGLLGVTSAAGGARQPVAGVSPRSTPSVADLLGLSLSLLW